LSHAILNNNNIKGITIDGYEIKNTLFADDATFLTDGSKESFTTLINILDNFSNISGLKLNTSKCTVLKSGSLKDSNIKYCPKKKFTWSSDYVKALGIYFYNDKTKNLTANLNPKLDDFKNCLKSWMHRKLTLLGKITVIKCFALPKLVYPLTVLTNPSQQTIQLIKKSMFNFLWDNKPDKIKGDIIVQDYKVGGLKMIDIEKFIKSLKSSWIKRILDASNNGIWKQLYMKKLNQFGGKLLFESNIKRNDIIKHFTDETFLQNILLSWIDINEHVRKENVSQEILWNNSELKIGGNTFYYKKNGIIEE
jgi:hypothetical protein